MNRFIRKSDSFFKRNHILDTFVFNSDKFDVIVIYWRPDYGVKRQEIKQIMGHDNSIWNIYIRFKPDFPGFDKISSDYNEFDLALLNNKEDVTEEDQYFNLANFNGGATFFKMDGDNKIFGCDYTHLGDEDVMSCSEFNEKNRCFIDAHKIIEQLEDIIRRESNGKN